MCRNVWAKELRRHRYSLARSSKLTSDHFGLAVIFSCVIGNCIEEQFQEHKMKILVVWMFNSNRLQYTSSEMVYQYSVACQILYLKSTCALTLQIFLQLLPW